MKKSKISLLALSVLAGGALAASAAAVPEVLTAYSLDATFTNLTADVWTVDGGVFTTNPPSATTPIFSPFGTTATTDGSGKITGSGLLTIINNANDTPVSAFQVTFTGKISSTVAGSPSVSVTVKGSGYTMNSNGVATPASITAKFNSSGAGYSSLDRIPGNLGGTITGITPGNPKSKLIIAQTGFLSATHDLPLSLSVPLVVQSSKGKVVLLAANFLGSGMVKTGSYTFNLSGLGMSTGSSVTLTGTEGSYTNISTGSTNIFSAPKTATISKGKLKGQVISGAAETVSAILFTGNRN